MCCLMFRRDRHAEERRRDAGEHRRGVRVRARDGEMIDGDAEPFGDLGRHRRWHAEIIDGDQDDIVDAPVRRP